jgi:predicted GNAT family acetyltransferase
MRASPGVRLQLTHDAEEFATRAESFLAERLETNVLATVLVHIRRGRWSQSAPLFAYALDARGRVAAAALRTPPWPLLVSPLPDPAAAELIELWLAADPAVTGVSGQPPTVRSVAAAWRRRTGGSSRCRMRNAMHALAAVTPPARPARGLLREATAAERDLLVVWERAFVREADAGLGGEAEDAVDTRLAHGSQYVWDDGGPVSTLVLSPEVAGVVRIGPVYTPPQHRSHGYASSAVAAVCEQSLAAGALRCMLFTDLANPTSNKIYAAVGFRRFGEWEEHEFEPPAG